MSDKLAFLDDEQPEPERPAEIEAQAEIEAPEPAPEQGEPIAAPPAAVEPEKPSAIPISALLDERERRQKAEREAEELRRWRQQIEAQQQAKPAPDIFTDPDQRLAHERRQIEQALYQTKLQQSQFLATREYGEAVVREAYDFFEQNPQLSHQFASHPSPFHAAVEFYKRMKVVDEIGADPEAWRNRERDALKEQLRAEIMAEIQPAQQPKPRIPGSLASAPAAGKAGEPRPRGSAFDAAFGG